MLFPVGQIAEQGVADDEQVITATELRHVEAKSPRQSTDAVQR